MALLLYLATAAALLWLAHRFVAPLTRGQALVLLLLPLVFTGNALLTGRLFGPFDLPYLTEPLAQLSGPLDVGRPHNGAMSDIAMQMIPWRSALKFALRHHLWPLWDRFILSGTILGATAQPAVYSPFTLIACILPIGDSITFTAAINFFIAALGAFLFARDNRMGEIASYVVAAAWMGCQSMAFFILWAVAGSWALLPFVLLGARRCVRQPDVRSAMLLMVGLTLLLLAGHPETALHVVFIGALYGLFELLRNRQKMRAAIAAVLAAGILSLLLTAIYILPILEAAPQTSEYQFRKVVWSHQPHGVSGFESIARILTDLFPSVHGMRWQLPGVQDLPLDSAAVGSVALGLAVVALIRVRRAETWLWGGMALFGILARAGWAPLANALQHLPLFDTIINERFAFAGAFALAMMAGLAVDSLFDARPSAVVLSLFVVLICVVTGIYALRRTGMVLVANFLDWGFYSAFGEMAPLALAVLALITLRTPRAAASALLILIIAQRWIEAGDIYATVPRRIAYPPIPILQPLKQIREPFRVVAQHWGMLPGMSTLYELEDVRGYEALTFARYMNTYDLWCVPMPVSFNRVDDLSKPFLSFLNVRFAVTTSPPPAHWHVVSKFRGVALLENENVIPRAFVPTKLVVGSSSPIDTTFDEMSKTSDFRQTAWIDAPMARHERQNGPGSVSIRNAGNGFRMDVQIDHDGWVIVSEPAWSGWRAYIDGHRVQTQTANIAFIGVYVPRGRHDVRLVYLPRSFVVGRWISFSTVFALVVFAVVRARRRVGAEGAEARRAPSRALTRPDAPSTSPLVSS